MDHIFFFYFAAVIAGTSVLVVALRNPVYSALALLIMFFHVAGLYVTLHAEFLAAVQIVVYAGAILVLYLFVVMLLNVPTETPTETASRLLTAGPRRFGALLSLVLVAELAWAMQRVQRSALPTDDVQPPTTVLAIGVRLFKEYAFAFEATSLLILVAMVGAVVLARKGE